MSRWALVLGTCVVLAGQASAAPAGMTITATKTEDAPFVERELAARLATLTCDGCHLDASVTHVEVATAKAITSVTAELSIAISDARGVIISVVVGHACAAAHGSRVASLRREALTAAIRNMSTKITAAVTAHPAPTWLATMVHTWFGPAPRDLPTS